MTDPLTLDNTAIVLDSTCDAAGGFFDRPGLYIVPLKVHFGDETYRDGVDMTHEEFFAKLEASEVLPTTSQPTVGEFTAVYEEATQTYDHVFSLHISGEMSGTVRAAAAGGRGRSRRSRSTTSHRHRGHDAARRAPPGAPRARRARWTRPRLHRALHRRTPACSSTPRPSSTCVAAAASAAPLRLSGGVFDIKPLIELGRHAAGYAKVRGLEKAWRPWSGSSRSTARPTTSCTTWLIDARTQEELERRSGS